MGGRPLPRADVPEGSGGRTDPIERGNAGAEREGLPLRVADRRTEHRSQHGSRVRVLRACHWAVAARGRRPCGAARWLSPTGISARALLGDPPTARDWGLRPARHPRRAPGVSRRGRLRSRRARPRCVQGGRCRICGREQHGHPRLERPARTRSSTPVPRDTARGHRRLGPRDGPAEHGQRHRLARARWSCPTRKARPAS